MKIAIMCSIAFAKEAGEIQTQLEGAGHTVSVPLTVAKILAGRTTVEAIESIKGTNDFVEYVQAKDLIRANWERMKNDDAILVVNARKHDIDNYIGANTFLEIGFAHVLGMKVFLWNDVPDMPFHRDEVLSMNPVILNADVSKIQ